MTYFRVIHTIMGPKCLTAVFGMGTGVATWVWSPARRIAHGARSASKGFDFLASATGSRPKYQKDSGMSHLYALLVSLRGACPCVILLGSRTIQGEDQCGQAIGC